MNFGKSGRNDQNACEKVFAYHIRLLGSMLSTGPWNRLPLSVRWLRPDLKGDLDFDRQTPPPIHMAITYGPIKAVKAKKKKKSTTNARSTTDAESDDITEELLCGLCIGQVTETKDKVQCISPKCQSVFHLVCLAEHFRATSSTATAAADAQQQMFLPVDGTCPVCDFRSVFHSNGRYFQALFLSTFLSMNF